MQPFHFAVAAPHFENDDIADHEWNESAQIPERPGPFHSVKSIPRWWSISVMTAAMYRRFLEKRATGCLGFTGPDRIRPLRSLAMMTNLIGAASFATIDKGPESHLGPPGHLAAPPVEWLRYLVLVHRAAALLHVCLRPVSRRRHCISPILHRHQTG